MNESDTRSRGRAKRGPDERSPTGGAQRATGDREPSHSSDCRPFRLSSIPFAFRLHKHGLRSDEYEDAWTWRPVEDEDSKRILVAIADGATEAIYSKKWAKTLVERFVDHPQNRLTRSWIKPAGEEFRRPIDLGNLPWYLQEKTGRGAFATLFGLSIDLHRGRFRTVSVGDSCLAVVHEDDRVDIVPRGLGLPAAFGSTPYLVASNPDFNDRLKQAQQVAGRNLPPGETTFLLMTDALAAWFVEFRERGGTPWRELDQIDDDAAFAAFVERARATGKMRNDDVTLVRLRVAPTTED